MGQGGHEAKNDNRSTDPKHRHVLLRPYYLEQNARRALCLAREEARLSGKEWPYCFQKLQDVHLQAFCSFDKIARYTEVRRLCEEGVARGEFETRYESVNGFLSLRGPLLHWSCCCFSYCVLSANVYIPFLALWFLPPCAHFLLSRLPFEWIICKPESPGAPIQLNRCTR
jgi:hypothetical protein